MVTLRPAWPAWEPLATRLETQQSPGRRRRGTAATTSVATVQVTYAGATGVNQQALKPELPAVFGFRNIRAPSTWPQIRASWEPRAPTPGRTTGDDSTREASALLGTGKPVETANSSPVDAATPAGWCPTHRPGSHRRSRQQSSTSVAQAARSTERAAAGST